tara:strand:+ start:1120 stop:1572 length:453 start_codon:yes stop_codon:yes gene_type:complete
MAYTPYKMKGHVLPGPNQASPAKQGNFMEQQQARTQEMMNNMRKQQDLMPDANDSESMQGGGFKSMMQKALSALGITGSKADEGVMTQAEGDIVPTPENNAQKIEQLREAISGGNQGGGSNAPEAIAKTQKVADKIKMPGISSWAKGLFG